VEYDFTGSFPVQKAINLESPFICSGIVVTCYFRHIQHIFEKAGIEVTKENKREIDKIIHNIVGVEYKNCPAAWREVKKRMAEDEEGFVSKLKEALVKHV